MPEAKTILPLHDTLEALRGAFKIRALEPNVRSPQHVDALRTINIESADEGQLDFDSLTAKPMTDVDVFRWAKKEFGDFKFVQRILYQGDRIIGEFHDYNDTHIQDVNTALRKSNKGLQIDPENHVESCSFILEHTRNRDQMDEYTTLLQLVDIFGLDAPKKLKRNVKTVAMYMDGAEPSDRAMAKRTGYAMSVEGISYEGNLVATGFIATPESATQAVYAYAKRMGISATTLTPHY